MAYEVNPFTGKLDKTGSGSPGGSNGQLQINNAGSFDGIDLDTDGTLAANSDTVVPSQKAVKTYVDTNAGAGGQTPTLIGVGETFTVEVDCQVLFTIPIVVDGTLVVDGALVEV